MKQFSTHDLLCVLMSSHKRSCVLMNTQEHSWVVMSAHSLRVVPCSWLHLCSHECSLLHGTKLMSAWLFMSANGCSCSWVLMITHQQHSWKAMNLVSWSNEYPWEQKSNHEQGAMRLWVLISTIAPYSWVLLGTHDHTWVLMAAHECSQQVMSAELFHQIINKKI